MRQGTITTVASTAKALSLNMAKRQLRIETFDQTQDSFVYELIDSAARTVENDLGFPIMRQTRQTHLTGWDDSTGWNAPACYTGLRCVWLGCGDNLIVNSVKYYDTAGVQQTLVADTDYFTDAVSLPRRICQPVGKTWPVPLKRPGGVIIDWTAGWATADAVPEDLKHAMKLLIGHWEQNREAVVAGSKSAAASATVQLAYDELLRPWRTMTFG